MQGKQIITGAADLTVGALTGNAISEKLGGGLTGLVSGAAVGIVAGVATQKALQALDDETGIVSDLGSVIDDVFSIF